MSAHVVAKLNDLPSDTRRLVTVKGRSIVVFNLGDKVFGLLNRCPHQGMVQRGEGLLQGPYVAETVRVTVDEEYVVVEI